jgi:hypothetical protein
MADLAAADLLAVSRSSTRMLRIIQLDDSWTYAALGRLDKQRAAEMEGLLSELADEVQHASQDVREMEAITSRYSTQADESILELTAPSGPPSADLLELRQIVGRYNDSALSLIGGAAALLQDSSAEVDGLYQEFDRARRGELTDGDLSNPFKCGIAQALIAGGH